MKKLYLCISSLVLFIYLTHAQDTLYLEKYFSNLKKIAVSIGGKPYSFLFDTGGGETFISPDIARMLGKDIYGSTTGFRMHGDMIKYQRSDSVSLNIGSSSFFHSTIGVWDIMNILPKELPRVDGVLSLKSFQNRIVTLDLANNRIILETNATYQKKIKDKTLLQTRFGNGPDGNELTFFLNIPYKRRFYWFLFDSGNLNKLLLSHNTTYEWGMEKDTISHQKDLGSLEIKIGNKQFKSEASSEDIIYDGSLNYAILSNAVFIINFPKKQVWLY